MVREPDWNTSVSTRVKQLSDGGVMVITAIQHSVDAALTVLTVIVNIISHDQKATQIWPQISTRH